MAFWKQLGACLPAPFHMSSPLLKAFGALRQLTCEVRLSEEQLDQALDLLRAAPGHKWRAVFIRAAERESVVLGEDKLLLPGLDDVKEDRELLKHLRGMKRVDSRSNWHGTTEIWLARGWETMAPKEAQPEGGQAVVEAGLVKAY